MNPPKKIAAIHDLSCLGRCALTVIIPTLSVMGYQVVPIPTAQIDTPVREGVALEPELWRLSSSIENQHGKE
jgi:pyridoxal/pyridoxine/pyridoxamine kinase